MVRASTNNAKSWRKASRLISFTKRTGRMNRPSRWANIVALAASQNAPETSETWGTCCRGRNDTMRLRIGWGTRGTLRPTPATRRPKPPVPPPRPVGRNNVGVLSARTRSYGAVSVSPFDDSEPVRRRPSPLGCLISDSKDSVEGDGVVDS